MAFDLPQGLRIVGEQTANSNEEVGAIEQGLAPGTRMLVAMGFAFKWPGFGISADAADWAARDIAGLQPWPEYGRVVTADPDGDATWWITYKSSPAWWMVIIIALGILILAAVTFRIVRWVAPEVAAPISTVVNLIPMLVLLLFLTMMPTVMKEVIPKALPGGGAGGG